MKTFVALALGVIVLAAFPGLSTAQAKRVEAKPPPDMVTLSVAQNVASSNGCVVIARPRYTQNSNHIYPNYTYVNFEKFISNNWVPLTPNSAMVTNSQGVAQRAVPWNTKIRVWIAKQNGQKAYSNEFTCTKQNQDGR